MSLLCKILRHKFDWINTSYIYRPKCPECDIQLCDDSIDEGYVPMIQTLYIPPTKVWCKQCGRTWSPDEAESLPHIDVAITDCERCDATHERKWWRDKND